MRQIKRDLDRIYSEADKIEKDDLKSLEKIKRDKKITEFLYYNYKLNSSNPIDQKMAIKELVQLSMDKIYNDSAFDILVERVGSNPPLEPTNKKICLENIKYIHISIAESSTLVFSEQPAIDVIRFFCLS